MNIKADMIYRFCCISELHNYNNIENFKVEKSNNNITMFVRHNNEHVQYVSDVGHWHACPSACARTGRM
jgi:hypothetical protein